MNHELSGLAVTISLWLLPLLVAITFHEAAHGFAAFWMGDDTAKRQGRMTLNPLAHIDPFGTILLPGMLLILGSPYMFGYARPVPVDFRRLTSPRLGMVLVAAAGPGINLLLALVSMLLLRVIPFAPAFLATWAEHNLANSAQINIVLALFNLLPLPPLDGGRIVTGLLPRRLAIRYASIEPKGMIILFGLLFLLPLIGQQMGRDLNIFRWIIGVPAGLLLHAMAHITGLI